ncbi:hypothetical protein [Winogradskyella jejuensis]|uniref:MG2 domain-containing protein n=1 Tax=Winogradskyella jejuensis TaxID=1089305 RepID=A0A1M5MBX5_9FLAO|nr:hypothetical protein [Winogradskyella jejuensis]SHG74233.1 hypothetical protein SAMN05444148_0846 [Winogradskyella jejuensis]
MKKTTINFHLFSISYFLFGVIINLNAQSSVIVEKYENYTEAPREIAYVHLNKSTYIEGEMMGFTAYVFDKYTKEPSKMTSNLYCTISNESGAIITKKLIRVTNGVASNVFDIDSTLSTGIFTFKAFTNWMRNFDENNHYEQTFKVIDADNLRSVLPVNPNDFKIDLQVVGEGGHILYDSQNTIGIIAKNQFGYGIASAYGNITNANTNEIISEFQLNTVGLAKLVFKPNFGQSYNVNLFLNDRTISTKIENIKTNGLVMNLTSLKDKVSIQVRTNKQSLSLLKNKTFKIGLNNGRNIIATPFSLSKNGAVILSFPKNELFSEMNIFTIFTQNDEPILERLYFNNNILKQKLVGTTVTHLQDSLKITLNADNIDTSKWSNLSISVLPSSTKSYNHHNNLLSQLYIQPYVNGRLENASEYFESEDRATAFNLDLLMLTQGWSSYDWKEIFTFKDDKLIYPFEQGIDITANIYNKKSGTYILYPFSDMNTQIFDVPEDEDFFNVSTIFPTDKDSLKIGYLGLKNKGLKEKPSLSLQFNPSKIPKFKPYIKVIKEVFTINQLPSNYNEIFSESWNNTKVTKLDEVVIKGKSRRTQLEALKEKATYYEVDILSKIKRLQQTKLDVYLSSLGWQAQIDYKNNAMIIRNPRIRIGDNIPLVYLNDAPLNFNSSSINLSPLVPLTTYDVEYIEYYIKSGLGTTTRGSAGYIKIYTNPLIEKQKAFTKSYEFPLKFNAQKTFYTPKYQSYNSDFFREYGTIAWFPRVTIKNRRAHVKIPDYNTNNMTLFIEGIVNNNQYISERITIENKK